MRASIALVAFALSTAWSARAAVLETEPRVFPAASYQRVRLDFPVGELRVVATDGSEVRFNLRVRCPGASESHCEEVANRLILDSDTQGPTLDLRLHRYPKWGNHGMKIMAELSVPRSLAVRIKMGVGELDIDGVRGDLDADLGVGEASIRAFKNAAGQVSVDTGIGGASIRGGGSDTEVRGFIGSHATWSAGQGHSGVRLHVGVGEGRVRLE